MKRWTIIIIAICLTVGLVVCEDIVWLQDPVSGASYTVSKETYENDKPFLMKDDAITFKHPNELAALQNECVSYRSQHPSLFQFINNTFIAIEEFCFHPERYPYDMSIYKRIYESVRWEIIRASLLSALLITIFRHNLKICFLSTSIGRLFTTQQSQMKVMTPLFNTFAYIILYIADAYVIFFSGQTDFEYPLCIFKTIRFRIGYFEQPIPSEYYWVYIMQLGFYLHSFYGTLFLDVKRKDWKVILLHHIITISLLHFSLIVRFYRIGMIVLFLHDISDIFLEAGKFVVNFRNRVSSRFNWIEHFANFCFFFFVITWFVFRVYLFPIKVLYATTWGIYLTHIGKEAHFFIIFNLLLWILFAMHVYWSYFILKMLSKIIMGTMPKMVDNRDYDSETEAKWTQASKFIAMMLSKIVMGTMPKVVDSRDYDSETESKPIQALKLVQTDTIATVNGHSKKNGFITNAKH